MNRLDRLSEELRDIVAGLDPAAMRGADAARSTRVAAEIERLGASAKLLLAHRAAETGGWVHGTNATTAEPWLAEVSGTSEHVARDVLVTARRLESMTETEEHLRAGTLSLAQASQVTEGVAVDPGAEHRLLRSAAHDGIRGLRAEKDGVVAARTSRAVRGTCGGGHVTGSSDVPAGSDRAPARVIGGRGPRRSRLRRPGRDPGPSAPSRAQRGEQGLDQISRCWRRSGSGPPIPPSSTVPDAHHTCWSS